MVALFMTAIAISNVIGSPVSGAIMQYMDGMHGWRGWQWLFLLEGIPSVIIGVLVFVLLPNGPKQARWLTAEEQELVVRRVEDEEAHKQHLGQRHSFLDAFRDRRVWALARGVFLRRGVLLRGQLLDADHHPGAGHRQEGFPQGRPAQHDPVGRCGGRHGAVGAPLGPDRRAALALGRRAVRVAWSGC